MTPDVPNRRFARGDRDALLVDVSRMRRQMFALIDAVIASNASSAPKVADGLQRAANELGELEAELRRSVAHQREVGKPARDLEEPEDLA